MVTRHSSKQRERETPSVGFVWRNPDIVVAKVPIGGALGIGGVGQFMSGVRFFGSRIAVDQAKNQWKTRSCRKAGIPEVMAQPFRAVWKTFDGHPSSCPKAERTVPTAERAVSAQTRVHHALASIRRSQLLVVFGVE